MKFNLFSWFGNDSAVDSLPDLFPFPTTDTVFIKNDIVSTYQKILNDTLERTHGLPEKYNHALYDNCLVNEAQMGLISLLANAMFDKKDLFLVYKSDVLRLATPEEKKQIELDYKQSAKSSVGVFISFKNYDRTDMLRIYSALEYYSTAGLHKSVNLSKAVQIKIEGLRSSVALADKQVAVDQMKALADNLTKGRAIGIDAKDSVQTAQVDTAPVEKAISFTDSKRASILGLPVAYVSGELTGGIGSTGEADMRQIERGLKQYFVTIVRPVLKALFGVDVTFKSQDFRSLSSALEALRTFDMVSDSFLPNEMKIKIVAQLFDLDEEELTKAIEAEAKDNAKNAPTTTPPSNSQGTQTATTQDAQGAGGVSA